jgi:3-oxoacyl-[acyl-carrier protein] reductase
VVHGCRRAANTNGSGEPASVQNAPAFRSANSLIVNTDARAPHRSRPECLRESRAAAYRRTEIGGLGMNAQSVVTLPFPDDTVALVTGGSRGIGRAIVLALAAQGLHIAFTYQKDDAAAEATVESAVSAGGYVESYQANVRNPEEVGRIVALASDSLGPIGILVNNAGIRQDRQFALMSFTHWQDVMDVNLTGPFLMTKAVFRGMCRRRGGTIVNVGSASSVRAVPGQANYTASKSGLIGLTKVLAKEGAPYGVRANVVLPGLVRTDMTRDVVEVGAPFVPLGRAGEPSEIAQAVVFLASPAASYVTGVELVVDGGLSI